MGTPVFAQPEGLDRRKAWWGVRYVGTICAQAGFPFVETPGEQDVHSLDGYVMMKPGLPVSVQVKCTHKPITRQQSWEILDAWRSNWERLDLPAYFIHVTVPKSLSASPDTTGWADHGTGAPWQTTVRSAAFWTRIDPLAKNQKTITVRTTQRLTVATLSTWAADLEDAVKGFAGGIP